MLWRQASRKTHQMNIHFHNPPANRLKIGSWSTVTRFVQTPFFRAVGLIPVLGYFILYGEAFQSWFNLSSISTFEILDGQARLRLVYFGSIFMLIALGLNAAFCPYIVKRFQSPNDYIEHVFNNLRPDWIARAVFEIHETAIREPIAGATKKDAIEAMRVMIDHSSYPAGKLAKLLGDEIWTAHQQALDEAIGELSRNWAETTRRPAFRHALEPLLNIHYWAMNEARSNRAQRITIIFATFGAVMVALPAIETFLRVVLIANS